MTKIKGDKKSEDVFYEEYSFLDWNINTYSSLYADWRKSDHGDKDHRNQEDLSEYILDDFHLIEEYIKGRDLHDWTEFKRKIASYMQPFLQYCENKFRSKKDRTDGAYPNVVPKKDKLCGLTDGMSEAIERMEMRGKAVRRCIKHDLGNFSPLNPNIKKRNSNRKK